MSLQVNITRPAYFVKSVKGKWFKISFVSDSTSNTSAFGSESSNRNRYSDIANPFSGSWKGYPFKNRRCK